MFERVRCSGGKYDGQLGVVYGHNEKTDCVEVSFTENYHHRNVPSKHLTAIVKLILDKKDYDFIIETIRQASDECDSETIVLNERLEKCIKLLEKERKATTLYIES